MRPAHRASAAMVLVHIGANVVVVVGDFATGMMIMLAIMGIMVLVLTIITSG